MERSEDSEEMSFSMDEGVAQQARAAAAREGMSFSAWVARSIRREALAAEVAAVVEAESRIRELIRRHKDLSRAALHRALGGAR